MENQLLETQIENIKMAEIKRDKLRSQIQDEKQRLLKQVQTMRGLAQAFET